MTRTALIRDLFSYGFPTLQLGGQGPLATDGHGCRPGALLDDSIVDSCDTFVAKGCSQGSKSLPSAPEVTHNDKQQVMAAGVSSGLDNCDCKTNSHIQEQEIYLFIEAKVREVCRLEIEKLKSEASSFYANETISSLQKENDTLKQRLQELESRHTSMKQDATTLTLIDENKSLLTAIRLLNSELQADLNCNLFSDVVSNNSSHLLNIISRIQKTGKPENRLRREIRHKTENSSNVNPGCDEFPVSIYPSNFPGQTDGKVGRETRQRRKSVLNSY